MATAISFNSNNLQTSTIITSSIDHESWPDTKVGVYEIAHANKSVVPNVTFPQKPITISGMVTAASISALDTALDTFRGYFKGKNKNLDIGYAGTTRRYVCTVKNPVVIRRPEGLSYANFSVEFIATEPFGRDTTTTSAKSVNAVTTTPYSSTFALTGSAPVQWPIITIVINSLTGGTGGAITFSNDENGQAVTITRDYTAGETIVIDCATKIVTVNGTEVDYTGAVPDFEPAATIDFTISNTFSARNFDYDIDYYKRYL